MNPGLRQKSLFHAEMAKLLEAGFDIRKAADVMRDTRLPKAQEALLDDLHRGLEEGKTITDAIGADRAAVSDLERHMIRAGERGGRLAQAFRHLAEYYEMIATARGEVIKGMIYPLVILHLGLLVGSLPGAAMLEGVKGADLITNLIRNLVIAYALAACLFFAFRSLWKWAAHDPKPDRFLRRVPWIGKARRDLSMARFCQVYHACLLSGVSMTETTRVACGSAQSGVLLEAGKKLAATAESGHALGPAFIESGAFPPAFARSYATAEEAGALDKDLDRWMKLYEADASSSIRHAAAMLPKICYVAILLYVGWQIGRVYLGYLNGLQDMME
ncbi:MAG: type II secretion system F family protein [Akkermansiaceae bacterium]|nr:type II secretion system F family protein [Akkermansiaceae bacterium]